MGRVDYKGSQLHYEVSGSGPALLFMHGLGADRQQSKSFLQSLTGFQVITVDMPGHGESPLSNDLPLKEQVGFGAYANAAVHLLEKLQITDVIAGGISMGAGIALHLALSSQINIQIKIQALMLIRPAWLDRPARPQLNIISDIGAWLHEGDQASAEEKLKSDPLYRKNLIDNPKCAASLMGAVWRAQAIESVGVYDVMVDDRPLMCMKILHQCDVPSLIIGNDFDPLHPVIIAEKIAAALGRARYVHLPPKYRNPKAHQEQATAEIERFLRDAA